MLAVGSLQHINDFASLFVIICVIVLYQLLILHMCINTYYKLIAISFAANFFVVYMYVHTFRCDLTAHLCDEFRLMF